MNTAFQPLTDFPRILIGPLFNPGVIGRYLGHPQIRTFMNTVDGSLEAPYDRCYDIMNVTASDLLAPWPDGWEPDVLVWWDGIYQAIPPGIHELPIRTVLIPGDWNIQLSSLWNYLPIFDHVFTDRKLLTLMEPAGLSHGEFWPGFSFEPEKHRRLPDQEKIYDITFVGNLNHHIQRQRGFLIERICLLSDRYRIKLACGVYGDEYVELLNQSRIVFNHSIRSEMNMRAYEAPACGALMFMEESNLEVRDFLEDGVSCVLYNAQNLEEKLCWYLEHEAERQAVAERGCQQIQAWSYEKQFEHLLTRLRDLPRQPGLNRKWPVSDRDTLLLYTRQIFRSSTYRSRQRALLEMLNIQTISASWAAQMGAFLISGLHTGKNYEPMIIEPQNGLDILLSGALSHLQEAVAREPHDPVWFYNLGWCLELMARPTEAAAAYHQVLALLERTDLLGWQRSLPVLPERYTHFEVEWEFRYRFTLLPQPDLDPLRRLLRWQTCLRLALVDAPAPCDARAWLIRAVQADPQLGDAPLLLARAWEQLGVVPKALAALRVATRNEPFQLEAWKHSMRLFALSGRTAEALELIRLRIPCLENYPTFDVHLPEFRRWECLLHALELLEQPATQERLSRLMVLLRRIQDPASVHAFLSFYLFLRFRLDRPWHWLFINLELDWRVQTPEPAPDLFPALNRFSGECPAIQIQSGPPLLPERWCRLALSESPLPGVLNHQNLPCLFPEPQVALLELEGLDVFNLLAILSEPLSEAEISWLVVLRDWAETVPGLSLLLWFQAHPILSEVTQVRLEQLFADTPLSVTHLTDVYTPDAQNQLMQQVQVVGGVFQADFAWYYRWAQAWGIPLWLGGELPAFTQSAPCQTAADFRVRFRGHAAERAQLLSQTFDDEAAQHQRFLTGWQIRLDWMTHQISAEIESSVHTSSP